MSRCDFLCARNPCVRELYPVLFRHLLWLNIVIVVVNILAANAAIANGFCAQQTLPASFPELHHWAYSIVRIEITKGSVEGSNESPPAVEFKVIEVLRPGRFPPPLQSKIVATWLESDQWSEHLGTRAEWSAAKTASPPTGTKLISFIFIPSDSVQKFLSKNSSFADTPKNRTTALAGEQHQPILEWLSEKASWWTAAVGIFTLASFISLFISPAWAPILSILAWLSYAPLSIISNLGWNALLVYPSLGLAGLTALIGIVLLVKSVGPD